MQPLVQDIGLAVLGVVAAMVVILAVLVVIQVLVEPDNLMEMALLVLVAAVALAQIITTQVALSDGMAVAAVLVSMARVLMALEAQEAVLLTPAVVVAVLGERPEGQLHLVRPALEVIMVAQRDGFVVVDTQRA